MIHIKIAVEALHICPHFPQLSGKPQTKSCRLSCKMCILLLQESECIKKILVELNLKLNENPP